jgi:2-dehydro-3-deoxyphosphogalactonate aldolase
MTFEDAFAELPLVAVLRGVRPDDVEAIGAALHRAGLRIVEVPLNSPDPMESIERLSRAFVGRLVIGAGTVRTAAEVEQVASAGGRIIVSPHTDAALIRRAYGLGLQPMPGVFTPTEVFAALDAGARYLKLFPASTATPGHLAAIRAVLPSAARIIAVGGISPADIQAWRAAGVHGFGLGSDLYKPGRDADEVFERAQAAVAAFRAG